MNTPDLANLAEQLHSLNGASDDNDFVRLVTSFQHNVDDIMGALLAKIPGRPEGKGHVFFYGRQSKDDKDQKHTEAGQFYELDDYYKRKLADLEKRWPPFFDKEVSGGIPLFRRPMGSKLNEFLRRGDHLVVTKLDRAFRSKLDGWRTIRSFEQRGISVHIINMGLDMSTPVGKLLLSTLLSIAEFEREMISVRTKEGLAAWRRKGGVMPSRLVPLGWKMAGEKGKKKLVPDPISRKFCEHCMERLEGLGRVDLVTELLKYEGCVNPNTGKPWSRFAIRHCLIAYRLGFPRVHKAGLHAMCKEHGLRFGEHPLPGKPTSGTDAMILKTFLGEPLPHRPLKPAPCAEAPAPADSQSTPGSPGEDRQSEAAPGNEPAPPPESQQSAA